MTGSLATTHLFEREVPVRGRGEASGVATLRVESLAPGQRIRRGLRALGLAWGAAVFAVLLPLLHFVLVPGLFGLGIYLGLRRLKELERVVGARGVCPSCQREQVLEITGSTRGPWHLVCEGCKESLRVG